MNQTLATLILLNAMKLGRKSIFVVACFVPLCGCSQGVSSPNKTDISRLQQEAQSGDSYAQRELGKAYRAGHSVARNYATAAQWYRKAADAGDAEAEKLLGLCYATGLGVSTSAEDAEFWFRRASDHGDADAQFYLGFIFDALDKNDEAMEQWANAAGKGNAAAQTKVGLELLESKERTKQKEGVAWLRKAAEQNEPTAQWRLGKFLDESIDVSRNRNEAVEWYRKSAEQGNRNARKKLLEMGMSDIPLDRYLISTKTGVPVKIPIPEGYELADSVRQAALDLESEILGDSILLPVFFCFSDLQCADFLPFSKPAFIRTMCLAQSKDQSLDDAGWERMRSEFSGIGAPRDTSCFVNGSIAVGKSRWEPISGPGWFGTFSAVSVESAKVEDAMKSSIMFSGYVRIGPSFLGVSAYWTIGTLEPLDHFPKVVESYLRQLYELNKTP